MSDLAELLERVKAATGPDEALGEDIWVAVVPGATRRNIMAEWPGERPIWEFSDPERNTIARFTPRITMSIDAALALTERVLPGWTWMMENSTEKSFVLWKPKAIRATVNEFAVTLPLAILAALLSALIAQEPQP